jgi:hypothetical protein
MDHASHLIKTARHHHGAWQANRPPWTVKEENMDDNAPAAAELLATVLESSMAQTQSTTEWVIDALRKEATEMAATLTVIRAEIQRLHAQPYAPNTDYVINALYPSAEQVSEVQKDLLREHWSYGSSHEH